MCVGPQPKQCDSWCCFTPKTNLCHQIFCLTGSDCSGMLGLLLVDLQGQPGTPVRTAAEHASQSRILAAFDRGSAISCYHCWCRTGTRLSPVCPGQSVLLCWLKARGLRSNKMITGTFFWKTLHPPAASNKIQCPLGRQPQPVCLFSKPHRHTPTLLLLTDPCPGIKQTNERTAPTAYPTYSLLDNFRTTACADEYHNLRRGRAAQVPACLSRLPV